MKNNNLEELIAVIDKANKQGKNSILVITDSITEEEIEKIRARTGIKNIKDVGPYFHGQASGKTEEYKKFMAAAIESSLSLNKFTYKNVLLEDGSIGIRMERLPIYVVIYTSNWRLTYNKKPMPEYEDINRYLPSFYYPVDTKSPWSKATASVYKK